MTCKSGAMHIIPNWALRLWRVGIKSVFPPYLRSMCPPSPELNLIWVVQSMISWRADQRACLEQTACSGLTLHYKPNKYSRDANMDNSKPSFNPTLFIYILAALISVTVAVIATWSDLEAAFYGFDRRASTALQNLRCPILLNRNETGVISVRVSNTTDGKLSPSVRADFSSALTPISALDSVELAPGESKTLEWTIGPENIDLKRFIFSKVLIFASYPLPDREATCGTYIVDLPIPGRVLLSLMVALGLVGMGGGWLVLNRLKRQSARLEKALRPLSFLTIVIVLALAASLAGWWVQAVLLLAVTLITIFVTVNFAFFR